MKKTLIAIILLLAGLVMESTPVEAVDVNNFYFSDFTGDYYLTKAEDGTSRLKVVESFTAEFPDYEQNKGMCRQIAFTNQDGMNVTLPSLTRENLKLTRNGETEPIYSISKDEGYYEVCTGTEEYVLGAQVYTFEYEFENVVTEFNDVGRVFQELYWDTNGNGARQRFDRVTARLHFADESIWTGESWCYVGQYGVNNQNRCTMTKTDDGVEFSATQLAAYENLTFDVELKAKSFVVPEPELNYAYVWLTVVFGVLCLIWLLWRVWKYLKSRGKAQYYKGLFETPQYQPDVQFSLPEMAEIYLGKKKDVKVAMLLELVVKRRVVFKKGEKRKWFIIVKDLNGVGEEYIDLLAILNNGTRPQEGDEVELKSRSATNRLITLRKGMESKILGDLKRDQLVENKYHIGEGSGRGVGNVIATTMVAVPVAMMLGMFVMGLLSEMLNLTGDYGVKMVFERGFYLFSLWAIVMTVIVTTILSDLTQKYAGHTEKGLRAARYMDGLRLYIGMAEAERMKMLQSVEGADTSATGIVKLYEKLLPYAAVFGLEDSWMKEMKKYCELEEIEEPDYLMTGITAAELMRTMRSAASYATTSTVMASSGGGSSSGFSGGGGGGFSGGGGGGGGTSGR